MAFATTASTALRAGFAIARDARQIATEWSRYYQDVMRHTSKAGRALLRARTFKDMLEVRAKLLRGTTQSFRDRIVRIVETASRTAPRPHDAPKEASVDQTGHCRADMAAESIKDNADGKSLNADGKSLNANAPNLQRGGPRRGVSRSPSAGAISQ